MEQLPTREDGYYWVLNGSEWTIAEWSSRSQAWIGILGDSEFNRTDSDFNQIDENRIVRQEQTS